MKVVIIGAGASGVVAGISVKRVFPKDEVFIIEHLAKPLKKIPATGNGKCNYGHKDIDFNQYNNPKFVKPIIESFNTIEFFDSINIKTKQVDNLYYPMSESAESVRTALLKECAHLKIKFLLNETIVDYKVNKKITVKTDKQVIECNKLIFATGGKSSPQLGSDGSIFPLLKKHGYDIAPLHPILCPVKVKENVKELNGVRAKVKLTLDSFNESGELLFKKDGISGMVTFNMSRFVDTSKKQFVYIDLLPEIDEKELKDYLNKQGKENYLLAYFNPLIAGYLAKISLNNEDLIRNSKALKLTIDGVYEYEFSHVSRGGVKIDNINNGLESRHEPNVYFVGEVLDIDAPCGGYNLTWAFASAKHLVS